MLRQQLAVTATTKAAKAKRGAKVTAETDGKAEAPLTPADEVLYEALKVWRIDRQTRKRPRIRHPARQRATRNCAFDAEGQDCARSH